MALLTRIVYWVLQMLNLPDDVPDVQSEIESATSILQHVQYWKLSTIGKFTIAPLPGDNFNTVLSEIRTLESNIHEQRIRPSQIERFVTTEQYVHDYLMNGQRPYATTHVKHIMVSRIERLVMLHDRLTTHDAWARIAPYYIPRIHMAIHHCFEILEAIHHEKWT